MRRRTVTANVLANLVNAGASIAAAAISVPLILHYVGLDGFGVWTLAQTALIYTATAETGFGPAVQRFVSVAHGAGDRVGAARIVWSASGFYLALGVAVAVLTALLASPIVSLFDVPPAQHARRRGDVPHHRRGDAARARGGRPGQRAAGHGALRRRRRGDGHLGGGVPRRGGRAAGRRTRPARAGGGGRRRSTRSA